MDLKTAKELDIVFNFFKDGKPHVLTLEVYARLTEKPLSFASGEYINELRKRKFIEKTINTSQEDVYTITFKGRIFEGFEKTINNESKEKRSQKLKYIITTFVGGLIGLLGVWLGHKLTEIREADKTSTNDSLKIQIVHDTVFVNIHKSDTSLVRIVKRK